MATIGLYIPGSQEGANALRSRLNKIAREMGYYASRGPTAGDGNLAEMLVAIDSGEIALVLLSDEELRRARRDLAALCKADPHEKEWACSILHSLENAITREVETARRDEAMRREDKMAIELDEVVANAETVEDVTEALFERGWSKDDIDAALDDPNFPDLPTR